jgi:ABC-type transport system substrate-binding protein
VRQEHRAGKRAGRVAIATALTFGLVAAACSKKDEGNDSTGGTEAVVNTTTGESTGGTDAPAETTTTVADVTPGGKIVVSGEAKVTAPWTPAKMQCDSYCQQRARTFFDPLAAYGADNKVHPYLAESITPNSDFTVWTIKLRPGINFTDGTPLNADAAIKNVQATGTGLLVAALILDVAKNPDGSLKIVKKDDMSFDIYMGKGGDPNKPLSWPGFDATLTSQLGFMASPKWLDAAKANPALETKPVGTGPFLLSSYTDDLLVVKKNPNYWLKDSAGRALPYLDEIDFKVIEDSQTAEQALESGDLDIFSTSDGLVVSDLRDQADKFPMVESTELGETNYLLIDLSKKGPLQDQRVRCALSEAIDRQEVIDATAGGIETPANGPFSPGQEGYLDDNGLKMDQDLEGAKALIDDYKKSTGQSTVNITYGKTPTATNEQSAELFKGYWDQIGVNTKIDTVGQDVFITNALFGIPEFQMYGWRNHAGITVDNQNFWWYGPGAKPDGQLSLNFGRLNDPVINQNLDTARTSTDPAVRKQAAEAINRQFGKECYLIPISWTIWGTPHTPALQGLGETTLPDGTKAKDGAGFPGQFWTNALWLQK